MNSKRRRPVTYLAILVLLAAVLIGGRALLERARTSPDRVDAAVPAELPPLTLEMLDLLPVVRDPGAWARCPDAERLARRHAPALAIAPDDQKPRPVELMFDLAKLVTRNGQQQVEVPRPAAITFATLQSNPEAFLTLPPPIDDAKAQQRLYEDAVSGDRAGRYGVTTYARVHCAATTAGMGNFTVIQYWLFYLFNDYHNKHEGDWELIQVVLNAEQQPLYAAYAQHNSYTWRRWEEVLTDTRDTDGDGEMEVHPRVYVARGSHASYFQYVPEGYGGDRVTDAREFIIPSVILLPDPDTTEPAFAWLRFPGRWGDVPAANAECKGCGPGPVGPVYNSGGAKWKEPLQWGSQRLTRDDLVTNRTARISLTGSARMSVYDEMSKRTGPLYGGRIETGIPGVAYLAQPGSANTMVLWPSASGRWRGSVEFTGGQITSLRVLLPRDTGVLQFSYPKTVLGDIGSARLRLDAISPVLDVDLDGDGKYERQVYPLDAYRTGAANEPQP